MEIITEGHVPPEEKSAVGGSKEVNVTEELRMLGYRPPEERFVARCVSSIVKRLRRRGTGGEDA